MSGLYVKDQCARLVTRHDTWSANQVDFSLLPTQSRAWCAVRMMSTPNSQRAKVKTTFEVLAQSKCLAENAITDITQRASVSGDLAQSARAVRARRSKRPKPRTSGSQPASVASTEEGLDGWETKCDTRSKNRHVGGVHSKRGGPAVIRNRRPVPRPVGEGGAAWYPSRTDDRLMRDCQRTSEGAIAPCSARRTDALVGSADG